MVMFEFPVSDFSFFLFFNEKDIFIVEKKIQLFSISKLDAYSYDLFVVKIV